MDEHIKIDVEEPGRELWTITLQEAIDDYYLDCDDVTSLKKGETIWRRKDTALSLHSEE